jgi:hypothetical protein
MDQYEMISGQQHGLYDVPEHEVLLSFNNDDDACLFAEWFYKNGRDFEAFVNKRQGNS